MTSPQTCRSTPTSLETRSALQLITLAKVSDRTLTGFQWVPPVHKHVSARACRPKASGGETGPGLGATT